MLKRLKEEFGLVNNKNRSDRTKKTLPFLSLWKELINSEEVKLILIPIGEEEFYRRIYLHSFKLDRWYNFLCEKNEKDSCMFCDFIEYIESNTDIQKYIDVWKLKQQKFYLCLAVLVPPNKENLRLVRVMFGYNDMLKIVAKMTEKEDEFEVNNFKDILIGVKLTLSYSKKLEVVDVLKIEGDKKDKFIAKVEKMFGPIDFDNIDELLGVNTYEKASEEALLVILKTIAGDKGLKIAKSFLTKKKAIKNDSNLEELQRETETNIEGADIDNTSFLSDDNDSDIIGLLDEEDEG